MNVALNVDSAEDLAKAPLKIDYDRQILKLISITSGGMLAAEGQNENLIIDIGKGDVSLSRAPGTPGVQGNGSLLNLTFITLAKGDASALYDAAHSLVKARMDGLRHVLFKPFKQDQVVNAVLATALPPSAPAPAGTF